ncbi:MAG: acyl-ACP--UDP-N-acetylglucosamine O-acyltransferase [Pseudomonadota bacterium]
MPSIHPTAIVEDGATLADDVEVGAFSYVGPDVVLKAGVRLMPRATVLGRTTLCEEVVAHPGTVLGGDAQIVGLAPEAVGALIVGPRTVLGDNVTLHTGSRMGSGHGETRIGADCFMMANSHFGHDCVVGDKCVIANSAAVGGHCHLGDQVWVAGLTAVHQFTRIGDHAFVGGGAILVADLPPYCSAIGNRAHLAGLNLIGLKRRGFSRPVINTIRHAYKALFHSEGTFQERLGRVEAEYASSADVMFLTNFIRDGGHRPLCQPEAV